MYLQIWWIWLLKDYMFLYGLGKCLYILSEISHLKSHWIMVKLHCHKSKNIKSIGNTQFSQDGDELDWQLGSVTFIYFYFFLGENLIKDYSVYFLPLHQFIQVVWFSFWKVNCAWKLQIMLHIMCEEVRYKRVGMESYKLMTKRVSPASSRYIWGI